MKINYSFIFLLIFSLYIGYIDILLIFLLCLILHEIGHIIFIIIYRIKIKKINLYAYGFSMLLDEMQFDSIKKYQKIIVFSGGLIVNLLLLIIFYKNTFGKYNLFLFLFNLLPIYPLDGYNILKQLINTTLLNNVVVICLIILFIVGYYINSLGLIIIFIMLIIKNIKYYKEKDKIYLLKIINNVI